MSEAGFTLVEVLVAFVASAILLVVLFDGMTVARERNRIAQDRGAALALADELLTARLAGEPVAATGTSGSRLSWKLDSQVLGRDSRGTLELLSVSVVVSGPKDRPLARLEGRTLTKASQ